MKLAVLADIHANFAALQTVAAHIEVWRPDAVVVAGDIVNRGPRSRDCLDFVQTKQQKSGWRVVRGNHEDYVIGLDDPDAPRSGPQFEFYRPVYWAYDQLGGDVSALKKMPFALSLWTEDAAEARITHASMAGIRDGIYPQMSDEKLRQKILPPSPLLCVGHTHLPLIRRIDNTLVVNVGSVGLPFDGDTRASYSQLTLQNGAWQAEIIRLEYNLQQVKRDFYETGFIDEGGPLALMILDELQNARSLMYQWALQYKDAVLSGQITMAKSVEQFMRSL